MSCACIPHYYDQALGSKFNKKLVLHCLWLKSVTNCKGLIIILETRTETSKAMSRMPKIHILTFLTPTLFARFFKRYALYLFYNAQKGEGALRIEVKRITPFIIFFLL